jgi:hypothetical protein
MPLSLYFPVNNRKKQEAGYNPAPMLGKSLRAFAQAARLLRLLRRPQNQGARDASSA